MSRNNWLSRLYFKYIEPIDPYQIRLITVLKSVLSISITGITFYYLQKDDMMWAILGALFIGMIQTGKSLKWRTINMFSFLVIASLIIPFFAYFSNYKFLCVVFVTLLAFFGIYAGTLGKSAGMMGMLLTVMGIVFTRFSIPLSEVPQKMLIIASGGIITFVINHFILPVKPRIIFIKVQRRLLEKFENLSETIFLKEQSDPYFIKSVHNQHHRIFEHLNKYRELPGFLNYLPEKSEGPKSSMIYFTDTLEKILDELLIIAGVLNELNKKTISKEEYNKLSPLLINVKDTISKWIIAVKNNEAPNDFDKVVKNNSDFQSEILYGQKSKSKDKKRTGIFLLQLTYQIRSLVDDLKTVNTYQKDISKIIKGKEKRSVKEVFKKLVEGFNISNAYFRYTLQVTIATALTMAINKYLNLEHGIWLVMFVVIIMKPTTGKSLKIGLLRIAGTIIGLFITIVYLFLTNHNHIATLILMIIGIIGFLYLLQSSYFVLYTAMLTIAMISLYYLIYPKAWDVSIIRSYDTFIAVIIGVVISFICWPNKAYKMFYKEIWNVINSELSYMKELSKVFFENNNISEAEKTRLNTHSYFDSFKENYNQVMLEPGGKAIKNRELSSVLNFLVRILYSLDLLLHYRKLGIHNSIIDKNKNDYKKVFDVLIHKMNAIQRIIDNSKENDKLYEHTTRNFVKHELINAAIKIDQRKHKLDEISNFLGVNYALIRLDSNINILKRIITEKIKTG